MKHAQHKQVFRVNRDDQPCCNVSRSWPVDARISAKAKGIMLWFITRKEGASLTMEALKAAMRDGKKAIKSGLRELRASGYVEINPIRGRKGRILGREWIINETPKFKQASNNVTHAPKDLKGVCRTTERPKRGLSEKGSFGESLFPDLQ